MFNQVTFRQAPPQAKFWQFISAILSVAFFLFLICWIFEPRWETNDDTAMSMVAHGYGLASHSSANLIFSNVLWGYLVRAIPEINGILGYSTATLLALFVAGFTTVYFLQRLGVAKYISIIAVCLILLRSMIFPQFTINAGLITVASILGFWSYARSGDLAILCIATLLAFLGYIVRSQECFLIAAIAAPLLPWRQLSRNREFKMSFIILMLSIASAVMLDVYSYSGDEWHRFYEMNSARAPYTDFGAGAQLKNHPQILSLHGYSVNDIDLIGSFFFIDPKIADPKALHSMLTALGTFPFLDGHIELGINAIKSLKSIVTWPMCFLAMILFFLRPKLSLFFPWTIFLSVLFLLGLSGRGEVFRVYMPLVALLYLAAQVHLYAPCQAFFDKKRLNYLNTRQLLGVILTVMVFLFNYWVIKPEAVFSKKTIRDAQKSMTNFPKEVVVSWGVGIPIESVFSLRAHDRHVRDMKMYPFGVFTHAPFSVSYTEEHIGRGFVDRLRSPEGILMVAYPDNIEKLRIWCLEHFQAELTKTVIESSPLANLQRVWC